MNSRRTSPAHLSYTKYNNTKMSLWKVLNKKQIFVRYNIDITRLNLIFTEDENCFESCFLSKKVRIVQLPIVIQFFL